MANLVISISLLSQVRDAGLANFAFFTNQHLLAPDRNRPFSPERSVERDDYLDNGDMDDAFLGNGHPGFEQSNFEQTAFPNSHPNGHLFEDSFSQLPQALQEQSGLQTQQVQQSQQPQQLQHQLLSSPWNEPSLEASSSLVARTSDTLQAVAPVALRRSSSSNGLSGQQRKGSLPSDYSLKNNSIALSNDWSREKVADMAHAARQRLQNPSSGSTVKKIGVSAEDAERGSEEEEVIPWRLGVLLFSPHRLGSRGNLCFLSLLH